MRDTLYAWNI